MSCTRSPEKLSRTKVERTCANPSSCRCSADFDSDEYEQFACHTLPVQYGCGTGADARLKNTKRCGVGLHLRHSRRFGSGSQATMHGRFMTYWHNVRFASAFARC